jgi:hypothetical protein
MLSSFGAAPASPEQGRRLPGPRRRAPPSLRPTSRASPPARCTRPPATICERVAAAGEVMPKRPGLVIPDGELTDRGVPAGTLMSRSCRGCAACGGAAAQFEQLAVRGDERGFERGDLLAAAPRFVGELGSERADDRAGRVRRWLRWHLSRLGPQAAPSERAGSCAKRSPESIRARRATARKLMGSPLRTRAFTACSAHLSASACLRWAAARGLSGFPRLDIGFGAATTPWPRTRSARARCQRDGLLLEVASISPWRLKIP